MPDDREPGLVANSDSSPPPPRTPVRRCVRLVGYNALSAAILLVLVELGLRLSGFAFALPPPRLEVGSSLPVVLPESFVPDPDLLWVRHGYRANLIAGAASRSRPSIVFMGDSTTRNQYERRLQPIIEERHPGSDFTYVTLGVPGWSSYSGLKQLQRDVLSVRPRAITINYGWNDHWNYYGLQDKDAARFLYPEGSSRLSAYFYRFRTIQLVNKAILALKQRSIGHGRPRVSLDDFRANLRQMVRIARANDVIPILFTAPTSHQLGREPAYLAKGWLTNLEDLAPLHQQYVQVVREVAAAENAPLVDLHHEFNQLPRERLGELFHEDGIH